MDIVLLPTEERYGLSYQYAMNLVRKGWKVHRQAWVDAYGGRGPAGMWVFLRQNIDGSKNFCRGCQDSSCVYDKRTRFMDDQKAHDWIASKDWRPWVHPQRTEKK